MSANNKLVNGSNGSMDKVISGIRDCVFRFKFPTLVLLAVLVTISLFSGTPDCLRPLAGLLSLGVGCILGTVRI